MAWPVFFVRHNLVDNIIAAILYTGYNNLGVNEYMLDLDTLLVVGVVVLIVFGPKRMPELARAMGKAMKEFKKASSSAQKAWDEVTREAQAIDIKPAVSEETIETVPTGGASSKAADQASATGTAVTDTNLQPSQEATGTAEGKKVPAETLPADNVSPQDAVK